MQFKKVGAIAVPLNFRLIPREIAFLMNHSDSQVLIFSSEFSDKILEANLPENISLICCGEDNRFNKRLFDLESKASDEEPEMFMDVDAVSRIQYTGGSTGIPKGVIRTHCQDLFEIIGEMMYSKLGENPDSVVLIQ